MKRLSYLLLSVLFSGCSGQDIPSNQEQIAQAILSAPEHQRDNATVMGFDASGAMVLIREGSNDFICIADDPNKEGFSVAAYHKSLEPFMARGRALKQEGLSPLEVFEKREEEVKAGTLKMPDKATLFVTTGDLNAETGEVDNLYTRFVVYIPYATEESTGLPLSPVVPGAPWIMDPGTHRAHIMINPPKNSLIFLTKTKKPERNKVRAKRTN